MVWAILKVICEAIYEKKLENEILHWSEKYMM